MLKIDGYVSKKNIRRWLENYESLAAGDCPPDAIPTHSAAKALDGWTGGKINKIMLDQAIDKIPDRLTKACVYARWIYRLPLGETLRKLGLTKDAYFKRCDTALDFVCNYVNGGIVGYMRLSEIIKNAGCTIQEVKQ